jgi:hypothetical protein
MKNNQLGAGTTAVRWAVWNRRWSYHCGTLALDMERLSWYRTAVVRFCAKG